MRDSTGTWFCYQLLCCLTRAATAYLGLGCLCSSGNGCLWARAGKLQVKSILSTKRIRQIPCKNVLIRDLTGLDTSTDRKSSWAIPPIKFQSYRWLLRCSAVHSPRDISRFKFFSSPKVLDVTSLFLFPLRLELGSGTLLDTAPLWVAKPPKWMKIILSFLKK